MHTLACFRRVPYNVSFSVDLFCWLLEDRIKKYCEILAYIMIASSKRITNQILGSIWYSRRFLIIYAYLIMTWIGAVSRKGIMISKGGNVSSRKRSFWRFPITESHIKNRVFTNKALRGLSYSQMEADDHNS